MSDVKKSAGIKAPEVDAATLKAFAHPLRMRMYAWLKDHGPGTASMLAEAMGESSGQTSYHLRQLARHGLIAEDPGRGTARERWWEARGFSYGLGTVEADPTAMTTIEMVMRTQVEERRARQLEWIERQAGEEREWQQVVTFNEVTMRMTPEELGELGEELAEVLGAHLERVRARRAEGGDAGTRVVKLYAQHFPLPADD